VNRRATVPSNRASGESLHVEADWICTGRPSRAAAVADPVCAARVRWRLTARQTEVLRLVARGFTNVLIAEMLEIGEGTVEFHLHAIFDKAGVDNRATLIVTMREG